MNKEQILELAGQQLADNQGFWTTPTTEGILTFAAAIRDQALDDAIDVVAFNGGSVQIEAHIRALKGEKK